MRANQAEFGVRMMCEVLGCLPQRLLRVEAPFTLGAGGR